MTKEKEDEGMDLAEEMKGVEQEVTPEQQATRQQYALGGCKLIITEFQEEGEKVPAVFFSSDEVAGSLMIQHQRVLGLLATLKSVNGEVLGSDVRDELLKELAVTGKEIVKAMFSMCSMDDAMEALNEEARLYAIQQELLNQGNPGYAEN